MWRLVNFYNIAYNLMLPYTLQPCARRVMFDCWLVTALNTITVEEHSTVATTLMTSSLLADLSCVSMESGVLPVRTIGMKNKLVLSAANWDLLVSVSIKVFVFKFCTRDGLLSF